MAGRPSSTPRLRDIDPAAFGAEIHDAVLGHIAHLAIRIDVTWNAPQGHSSSLRWTAQLLAGYAQIGLPATDWPDHGCASDALLDVCSALYSCAGEPDFGLGELEGEVDATTPVGIVLLAAHARVRIATRQRVPVRELAALAGVDAHHVRLLGRKGELEVDDATVRAAECRRWLSGRGVKGL